MKRLFLLLLAGFGFYAPAMGQHSGHDHSVPADSAGEHLHHARFRPPGMGATTGSPEHVRRTAASALLPGMPMERDGSGTSWLPGASPMHAIHKQYGAWSLMVHGSAFLRYNAQDVFESGTRGDRQFDAPNWIMGMAQRPVSAGGQIAFRSMLTLDPLTVGASGYPLLFQTGETYRGAPLVDRQHPHDLFAEMAVMYGHRLGEKAGVFAYVGYPGEPALGPPAFMHRTSAQHNPDAPLGHHWQDATHIVFGVATLGLSAGPIKIDGSVFTGREPDEERYGFDRPRFDSYSARLSLNPTRRLALQVSRGYIKRPEHYEPGIDKRRTTASVLYTRPAGAKGDWSSTLAWGYNEARSDHGAGAHSHGNQHSFLAETDLQIGPQAFYGRAEWVQKSPSELRLESGHTAERLDVGALTLGAARDVASAGRLQFTLGAQGTLYRVPAEIRPVYGEHPVSIQVYLRISPVRMMHVSSAHTHR